MAVKKPDSCKGKWKSFPRWRKYTLFSDSDNPLNRNATSSMDKSSESDVEQLSKLESLTLSQKDLMIFCMVSAFLATSTVSHLTQYPETLG